jgi:ATP-dependent Clp protease ATP-binding subunit ClpB
VDFRNTVVIMTSNIGSPIIQEMALSGDVSEMKRRVMEAVQMHFRPEFLNRVDEIILFGSLSVDQIKSIVDIQLELLKKRLSERKLTLELTDAAKQSIAISGYDPVYGARPLKRAIQRHVTDPMAQNLLAGEFREGDTIVVDADAEGVLTFRKQE